MNHRIAIQWLPYQLPGPPFIVFGCTSCRTQTSGISSRNLCLCLYEQQGNLSHTDSMISSN